MTEQEKDERYMRLALDEAHKAADEGEIPIGCIVVCRDRVVARSHNLTETLCDVTAHAEMQAITAAANTLGGKYLTDCTLYVTVEPCPMCAGALGRLRASSTAATTPSAATTSMRRVPCTPRQTLLAASSKRNAASLCKISLNRRGKGLLSQEQEHLFQALLLLPLNLMLFLELLPGIGLGVA